MTRLLRRENVDGLRVELENLLARSIRVQDVTPGHLQQIADRHGADPRHGLSTFLEGLFSRYLGHCLDDRHMTDIEVEDLVHLKQLFGISDQRARTLHDEAASGHFRLALDGRAADRELDDDDREFLQRLQDRLLLSEEHATRLRRDVATDLLQIAEIEVTGDLRLSPDEESELDALAQNLSVRREAATANPALLQRLRTYWQLENAELPIADVPINLPGDEAPYLRLTNVQWLEYQQVTRQIGYQRPERFPLFGSPSNNAFQLFLEGNGDEIKIESVTADELRLVDTGQLYFTSKRVIFDGPQVNRSIDLTEILNFAITNDGLSIELAEGRPTIVRFAAQMDVVNLLLARLIREANASVGSD